LERPQQVLELLVLVLVVVERLWWKLI